MQPKAKGRGTGILLPFEIGSYGEVSIALPANSHFPLAKTEFGMHCNSAANVTTVSFHAGMRSQHGRSVGKWHVANYFYRGINGHVSGVYLTAGTVQSSKRLYIWRWRRA